MTLALPSRQGLRNTKSSSRYAAGGSLRKGALLRQHFVLTPRQTQPVYKHFFIVCSQARRGAAHAVGRFAQFVRYHPVGMIPQLRMLLLLPDISKRDLRIREQVANSVNLCRVHSAALQTPHEMFCALLASPISDQLIQFTFVLFSAHRVSKTVVRQPARLFRGMTKPLPFLIVPATNDTPFVVRTRVTTMRHSRGVAIAVAVRDDAIRCVINRCAGDELDTGFELRKIDVRAFARSSPMVQSREHCDAAKGHGDEIDIRAIQKVRRPIGFANQMRESA